MTLQPRVLLANGALLGRQERDVLVFRGVPFAHSGAGGQRFRAAEKLQNWVGNRDASRAGRAAPQAIPRKFKAVPWNPVPAAGIGEDCLNLDLWTPALDGRPRPVMVWIHGGGFSSGSGSFFLYSGAHLARRGDVVVVCINYRLGPFGALDLQEFPAASSADSNPGLRDQIAALHWVRENIADFGGDPENVTLFGQSAGAMSIATLMVAPAARNFFRRAILQSGAVDHVHDSALSRDIALHFCRLLRIDPDRRDAIDRLRALPAASLVEAQLRLVGEYRLPLGTLTWQPCVDGDLIPTQPMSRFAAGEAAGIPTLIGTNLDEWKMFTAFDRKRRDLDEPTLRSYLARTLAPHGGGEATSEATSRWVEEALCVYGREAGGLPREPAEAWVAFQSARVFGFPAVRLAEAQCRAGAPTWVYRFEASSSLLQRRLGACHSLELPFVFGTLRTPWFWPWLGYSGAARKLSDRMQDAWLAFARDARPPQEGDRGWLPYHSEGRATVLGGKVSNGPALSEEERIFWMRLTNARQSVESAFRSP